MPTVEYLREQLASQTVARYLETGEPVYMITAVKTVYGAKAKEISTKKISAELKTPIGGPAPTPHPTPHSTHSPTHLLFDSTRYLEKKTETCRGEEELISCSKGNRGKRKEEVEVES